MFKKYGNEYAKETGRRCIMGTMHAVETVIKKVRRGWLVVSRCNGIEDVYAVFNLLREAKEAYK